MELKVLEDEGWRQKLLRKDVRWVDGDFILSVVDDLSAGSNNKAKKIFNDGKIKRRQTSSKLSCFNSVGDVDRSIVISKCFFSVPFLLFDSKAPSAPLRENIYLCKPR